MPEENSVATSTAEEANNTNNNVMMTNNVDGGGGGDDGDNANNTKKYSVIFHCVSAGLNGSLLGSDEQEIVQIVYLIYDLSQNKVRLSRSNFAV